MDNRRTRERLVARIILIDRAGRTLLFNGGDPARPAGGTWWFTPGGGVEPGETIEDAARRELFEETGVRVDDLGPVVYERYTEFAFDGDILRQQESYFRVRVNDVTVDDRGWTDLERRNVDGYRWWSVGSCVRPMRWSTRRIWSSYSAHTLPDDRAPTYDLGLGGAPCPLLTSKPRRYGASLPGSSAVYHVPMVNRGA